MQVGTNNKWWKLIKNIKPGCLILKNGIGSALINNAQGFKVGVRELVMFRVGTVYRRLFVLVKLINSRAN